MRPLTDGLTVRIIAVWLIAPNRFGTQPVVARSNLNTYIAHDLAVGCRTSATPPWRSVPLRRSALFARLIQRQQPGMNVETRGERRLPRVPDGVRVYVIGDVHGRLDLLREIEERIIEDLATAPRVIEPFVVYLGDYVDRGLDSRGVLQWLIDNPILAGVSRVLLAGNHDWWLGEFLRGQPVGASWIQFGGDATLASYGVRLDISLPEPQRIAAAQKQLLERLPAAHRDLLAALELSWSCGDYYFCHAGIRPGVPLDQQSPEDLLWIREPFLSWRGDPGKVIVHGHTVSEEPVVRPNRIGIDTGAYLTGRLTCLVLEGTEYRFFATGVAAAAPAEI